jgi:hypothetical protein
MTGASLSFPDLLALFAGQSLHMTILENEAPSHSRSVISQNNRIPPQLWYNATWCT